MGKDGDHRVQQIVDATAMLGGDGKHISNTQAVKIVNQGRLLLGINFVDRQEERLTRLAQQPRQLKIGSCQLATTVHDHHDRGRFVERHARLTENLGGYPIFFVRQNPARVHDAHPPPAPLRLAIEPVASDARFVAHDGTP